MEEEIRRTAITKDALQRRAELEMAKKAEEAMKITSLEKLLYTLEDKERTIARMRIESEREIFELQKQLVAAKHEIVMLSGTVKEAEIKASENYGEIESLKAEIQALRSDGSTLDKSGVPATDTVSPRRGRLAWGSSTNAKDSKAPSPGGSVGSKKGSILPDASSKGSASSRFSLGGFFGGGSSKK